MNAVFFPAISPDRYTAECIPVGSARTNSNCERWKTLDRPLPRKSLIEELCFLHADQTIRGRGACDQN